MPSLNALEAVQSWVASELGDYRVLASYREGSSRTGVWRVTSGEGEYILKLHSRRLRWYTEVTSYQRWAEAYAPFVPRLRAVCSDGDVQGILVSAIPGIPLREVQFASPTIERAFRQAGELCRRLKDFAIGERFGMTDIDGTPVDYQGQPVGDVLYDPVRYVTHSFVIAYERALGLNVLVPRERNLVESALDDIGVFADEQPVLVNGDFTPGNWLVDDGGAFSGVIDLEHLSWDVEVAAFTRLQSAYFPDFPAGEKAFFEGYGADVHRNVNQSRILRIRHALKASMTLRFKSLGLERNVRRKDEMIVRRNRRQP